MSDATIRFLLPLLALLLLGAGPARAQELSDAAEVSLLTILPGDDVYSLWGHSAVRVHDPVTGVDASFNYGTFDFDAFFVPRFLYGELDYFLSVYPVQAGLAHYRAEGRPVVEQRLNLSPEQARALFRFLRTNALPENRYYRYDFLYDNCSTRIRDAFAETLGDALRFGPEPDPGVTFRRLIDPYLAGRPFLDAGVDLLLGLPVDEVAGPRETMFLPDYLLAGFDAATIEIDGRRRPLVASTDTLLRIDGYARPEAGLPWALLLFSGLLAAGVVVTWRGRRDGRAVVRWLDVPLFAFAGFAGLLIAFLWFVSLHDVTALNWHLVWAWPTHLVAAALVGRRRAAGGWLRPYLVVAAASALAVLAAAPFLPQPFPAPAVPLVLLLALRAGWIATRLPRPSTPEGRTVAADVGGTSSGRGSALLRSLLPLALLVPTGAGAQPLRMDPAVRADTLANGFTYFIRENAEPAGRVELRLLVDAGSVLEEEDQRGLAHVVEHMAFNGTARFERQALVDYLETIGMRFGPEINASTGFDQTLYQLTVPTDSAAYLETAFDILADWASAVTFAPEEVERERGVVVEEWRLRRNADLRMTARELAAELAGSPYPDRLPIGTRESLETFTRQALVRFYETWYRPELMALVAVGDVEAARLERLVRDHFAPLENPSGAPPRPEIQVPVPDAPRFAVLTDPEAAGASVAVQYEGRPAPVETGADFRREIVESLYFGILTRRLGERARAPDAPFLDAYAYEGRLVRSLEVQALRAGVADGGILRGLEALLTEAERLRRHGVTPAELARQKAEAMNLVERNYRERAHVPSAAHAGALSQYFFFGTPVLGPEEAYRLYRELLPTITPADVQDAAERLTAGRPPVVLVRVPDGAAPPSEAALAGVVARVRTAPVAPYAASPAGGPLLPVEPQPGSIVAEETGEEKITWTLSNGARVVLKPTDFREDEVLFAAHSPGGTSLAPDSSYVAAATATAIVEESGVGGLDREALRDRLAGAGVSVTPYVNELYEGLSGTAASGDVETLLQLAHLYMTAPRADSSAFVAYRERMQGLYEHRHARPESVFADTIRTTMAQHHPRERPWTPALFGEMDLEESLAFYRDRFGDADEFTFFFVGAFEPDSLRPLVERYLASLPAREATETWRDVGIRPPEGIVRKVVRRGVEPKSRTQILLTGPFTWTAENRLAIAALAGVLQIRLRESLREALGGTYSVLVSARPQRDPFAGYRLSISFGADPDRLDALTDVVFAHLDTLRTEGPAPERLAKVKAAYLRAYETDRETNRYWLGVLQFEDRYGPSPDDAATFPERVEALTPADLREAARAYLDPSRYVQVSLKPEE